MLAFRIGLQFFTEATASNALAFGLSVGAALSISPDLLPTLAIFALAAALSGLYELLFAREFGERLLFWVTRNARFSIIAFLSAVAVWLTLATGLFAHPPPLFDSQMLAVWDFAGYRGGWHFLLPALSLYEFLTVLLAVAGSVPGGVFVVQLSHTMLASLSYVSSRAVSMAALPGLARAAYRGFGMTQQSRWFTRCQRLAGEKRSSAQGQMSGGAGWPKAAW